MRQALGVPLRGDQESGTANDPGELYDPNTLPTSLNLSPDDCRNHRFTDLDEPNINFFA
jgi:hypothetical protein